MVALTSSRQYAKDTDKNSRIRISWVHHHTHTSTYTYTYETKRFFFKLHSPPNHMLLWPHSSPFPLFFSFKPHQLRTLSHFTAFSKKDRQRPRWNRTALAFAAGGDVGSTSGIQLHLSTSGIQLYLSTISSSSSGDQRHLSSAVYHQCYNSSAAASDVHRQHNIKPSAPQPAGAAERWIADGGAGGADSWDRDRRVNCADWRGYFRNLL